MPTVYARNRAVRKFMAVFKDFGPFSGLNLVVSFLSLARLFTVFDFVLVAPGTSVNDSGRASGASEEIGPPLADCIVGKALSSFVVLWRLYVVLCSSRDDGRSWNSC